MDQTVLMNSDIYKSTEVNNIADSSLQYHTLFQVFHIQDIGTEDRFRHLISWISGRFFQLFYDITKSRLTDLQLFCQFSVIADLSGNASKFTLCHIFRCVAKFFQEFFGCVVALRMDTGCIQRIFAPCDPCETCTLLKSFRSQLGNFQKFSSCLETAVFFTVSDDIFCNGFADSGNVFQKGCGCGIQIHADFINTVFYNAVQCFAKLLLVHVMLILAHTDGFRVDLYKLCQRVLNTSCDGCGTSLSHIEIRELFCCKLACRIYGSSCLVGDHILNFFRDFLKKFHDDLLGLSGCGSVSYGNQGHVIFADEFFEGFLGCTDLVLVGRRCWIDHCSIQNFSGWIYHCKLTSRTERRVPSKNYLPRNWRLHEKLLQIFTKDMDGTVFCCFRKSASNLTLDGRSDKTFVAVLNGFLQHRCGVWIVTDDHLFLQIADDLFLRCKDLHCEEFLFLTTVQGKDTMAGKLLHRLLEIIIHLVYGLLFLISRSGTDRSFIHGSFTDADTVVCLIRNMFRKDIPGAADGFFHSFDFFLF